MLTRHRRALAVAVAVAAGTLVLASCVQSAEEASREGAATEGKQDLALRKLTPEEEAVIVHKGTERPFTGEYYDHHEAGTYVCRQCGTALYESTDKFDSGCGWPSFDDEIPGAVRREPDADGRRTEILCAACGAHLGHVFEGERMTDKNVRHCVNSISLEFVPAGSAPDGDVQSEDASLPQTAALDADGNARAYFAGGCFWGVEHLLQEVDGVSSVRSGYMGGDTEDPTYREVCSGNTGHAETVEVVFDPSRVDFEALARLFFEIHDPTQVDRQGPDRGSQYRSAVFYADLGQKAVTERLVGILRENGYDVATEVSPAGTFWPAEDYHQDYYEKSGGRPYCHAREKRF
jgi:peptide methionine sulfoxide reductase msrA/msrB